MKENELSPPTEKEISKLPRLAKVAFAARCARRVVKLFPKDLGEKHFVAVNSAVELAERMGTLIVSSIKSIIATADAAREAATYADIVAVATVPMYAARAATHAVNTVTAAARETRETRKAKKTRPNTAHSDYSAHEAAAYACGAYNRAVDDGHVFETIRLDFDRLIQTAQSEKWDDHTPVPPEFFGPLWPNGPPEGWPEFEGSSENKELVLTIDVPEGMTDDQVLELLENFAVKADRVHRAHGGHGLQVDEGDVDIELDVSQPVTSGGLS